MQTVQYFFDNASDHILYSKKLLDRLSSVLLVLSV